MSTRETLPLIVMAGSDRQPVELPDDSAGLHPLSGYKAADITLAGQPLLDRLLERLEESALFGPIFVAGPRRIYGETRRGAKVIDTDKSLGENLEVAFAAVTRECPGQPLALTACDVLPAPGELQHLLDDYRRWAPLDFWFPLILTPEKTEDLGASAWKPEYRIAPRAGEEPSLILPGHLVVVDPQALRLPLIYRAFNLAYRTRNRPVLYRMWLILSRLIGWLVLQDLRGLSVLRPPTLTATVVFHGVLLSLHLRSGTITSDELAARLRQIYVTRRHRRRYPDRRGRLPLMQALSLAKDVDTVEEAEEIARQID